MLLGGQLFKVIVFIKNLFCFYLLFTNGIPSIYLPILHPCYEVLSIVAEFL